MIALDMCLYVKLQKHRYGMDMIWYQISDFFLLEVFAKN